MARKAALTVVVVFLFAAIAAFAAGSYLIAPNASHIGNLPDDLPGESVLIPSGSGSTLHGWFVPGQDGVVVLLHGVRANRQSMLGRARLLHDAGFSVLLFDFQANGESPGAHVTFGYLESRDAQAAVDYVRARLPGERVGVIGMSMGGAAAILAQPSLQVDALVVEAVYPDLDRAVANRLGMRLGSPARWLAPVLTLQLRPRLGISTSDLRPIDSVGNLPMPKLFIAGSLDEHTPIDESQALFDTASEPKAQWVVAGARHVDFNAFDPDEYRRRVLEFLVTNLRPRGENSELRAVSVDTGP